MTREMAGYREQREGKLCVVWLSDDVRMMGGEFFVLAIKTCYDF